MTVCYLEVDDEITSAIGRIRAVQDGEAIIVIPPGSRIATGRINFKLLAREANERQLTLVAVSDEPQVRALAISAGLPAYDSLAAAEQALISFREQDRRLAARLDEGPEDAGDDQHPAGAARRDRAGETLVLPGLSAAAAAGKRATSTDTAILPGFADGGPADVPDAAPAAQTGARRRRKRSVPIAPVLVVVLLAVLVVGVAYGAYVFLPTASITLRPIAAEIRLPSFTVTADTNVAVVDPDAGVIPAEHVAFDLHVDGQFVATGIAVHETRATGSARFRSENTLNAVAIPAGTVVSTIDGIDFATVDAAVVPAASFATGPSSIDVAIRAVRTGTRSNVAAGTITELAQALKGQLISVNNPDPTSGGRHLEETAVSQEDYDGAVAALTSQLLAAVGAHLADPGSVPRGLVAFPDTAMLGDAQPDQASDALVGTVTSTFTLALDTTAQVVAVNEAPLDDVAAARVQAQLDPGQTLVGDALDATRSSGTVAGQSIVYNMTVAALAYSAPDVPALVATVRGKSVEEARQALAQYGTVDIAMWPEFVDHIPDQTARISFEVLPPVAGS